jgi:ubiquitin-like protein Nedd8
MVVVDESVLALTGYTLNDPIHTFFQHSFGNIKLDSTHQNLLLARILDQVAEPPAVPNDGCITIMYFSGRVLKFEVKNTISIAALKALVQERDGLPPPTQRLLYKGKQLPDDGTLAAHGVPDGAVINLVLRLFGGGVGDDKVFRFRGCGIIYLRNTGNTTI